MNPSVQLIYINQKVNKSKIKCFLGIIDFSEFLMVLFNHSYKILTERFLLSEESNH